MRLKLKMHGDQAVRVLTRDDNPEEILQDFEEGHPMPGATREDARRRKLLGVLPADRYSVEKVSTMWRVWDEFPESPGAMGPGAALAAALRNASNDASRTDDADDRRVAANASLPMPRRLAALARINRRALSTTSDKDANENR